MMNVALIDRHPIFHTGYLDKSGSPEDVMVCLNSVTAGEPFVCNHV